MVISHRLQYSEPTESGLSTLFQYSFWHLAKITVLRVDYAPYNTNGGRGFYGNFQTPYFILFLTTTCATTVGSDISESN